MFVQHQACPLVCVARRCAYGSCAIGFDGCACGCQLFSVTMYDVLLPLPRELAQLGYSDHKELIKEMVAQRLAQNYQLVLFDNDYKPLERTSAAANAKPLFSLILGRRIHHVRAGF